jgi:hypothetical protein
MSVEWQGDHKLLTDKKVAFERASTRTGTAPTWLPMIKRAPLR